MTKDGLEELQKQETRDERLKRYREIAARTPGNPKDPLDGGVTLDELLGACAKASERRARMSTEEKKAWDKFYKEAGLFVVPECR